MKDMKMQTAAMRSECEEELTAHILPFWMELREKEGYVGLVTRDLVRHPEAPKGVILHARILWTFSAAYLHYRRAEYLEHAVHAFRFLLKAWDPEHKGFYWSLTANGFPLETNKYAYCQAFCLYAVSLFYEASGEETAADFAGRIFRCIETHYAEPCGYLEAFREDWTPLENDHLSEHDLHAAKTMNTTLHLIEAYAEYYRSSRDAAAGEALRRLLLLMADRIYDPGKRMLRVFFDSEMHVLGDLHSYGHDIEVSWLLDDVCAILGDAELTARFSEINYALVNHVYDAAFHGGALYNERFGQETDQSRIWWVLAEGVVGFLNAADKAKKLYCDDDAAQRFTEGALTLWGYLRDYQIDRRKGGEWFAETDTNGRPQSDVGMVGIWKCPYHNSRMCLEVIKRVL